MAGLEVKGVKAAVAMAEVGSRWAAGAMVMEVVGWAAVTAKYAKEERDSRSNCMWYPTNPPIDIHRPDCNNGSHIHGNHVHRQTDCKSEIDQCLRVQTVSRLRIGGLDCIVLFQQTTHRRTRNDS